MQSRLNMKAAFSLIELVVVLVIVTVLAGLVVAVLPNLLERSHLAKCADTIAALNNAWMRSHALTTRYPDVYDSLLAADGGTLDSRLSPGLLDQTTPYPLTAADVDALATIGITRVVDLQATAIDQSATYDSAPLGAAARVLTTGGNVAELDLAAHVAAGNPLALKRHLVRQADGGMADNSANVRYVVFGIGPNCTAVGSGRSIQEAPVHFAASDRLNPTHAYQRYLVVFSLTTDSNGDVIAAYEAAAGNDIGGPSSAEAHIQQFHAVTATDG